VILIFNPSSDLPNSVLTYSVKSKNPLLGSWSQNESCRDTLQLPRESCTGWNVLKTASFFLAGTAGIALNGEACYKDFIVIPNPTQNPPVNTDRFCGNALIATTCKYPELFI
jgi:hypothetical protein